MDDELICERCKKIITRFSHRSQRKKICDDCRIKSNQLYSKEYNQRKREEKKKQILKALTNSIK